jgi:hypothetical protein
MRWRAGADYRHFAAMLAPHFLGLFCWQSDFGHPVGADLGDMIVSDFPQNLACGTDRNTCKRRAGNVSRVFVDIVTD